MMGLERHVLVSLVDGLEGFANTVVPSYGFRMVEDFNNRTPITIRDLYPNMSDAELAEAEANLKAYVAVIVRIYDRLKAEGKEWPGQM